MTFKEYLNHAWSTHANEPEKLASEFKNNFNLMETEDDVMSMSHLIVHVCGEHLGKWQMGLDLLKKIKNNATIKDKNAMKRYVMILTLGNNPNLSIDDLSSSDQAIVYATTACALVNLGGIKNAEKLFKKAILTMNAVSSTDPANRALAINGNNIAGHLEQKIDLSDLESAFMLEAAIAGRKYWELAGSWKEVERAEYRLSKSYLKINQGTKALLHAEKCLEIVEKNNNEALEAFFAHKVMAESHINLKNRLGFDSSHNAMKLALDKLDSADQSWCAPILEKIVFIPKKK